MDKCTKCKAPIIYKKTEVFCSECGTQNHKYLTDMGDNGIDYKIDFRIKQLFENDPQYLYFLFDNYNGVGDIYKTIIRFDIQNIKATHWISDKDVTITFKSDGLNMHKRITKQGTKSFDISTTKFSTAKILVSELLRTYPINGMNMHHTADEIAKNTRHSILSDAAGNFYRETTKEIYDEFMVVKASLEKVLEFIQPHPKQIIPKG